MCLIVETCFDSRCPPPTAGERERYIEGYLDHEKPPHHLGPLHGPRHIPTAGSALFPMIEVPLYMTVKARF